MIRTCGRWTKVVFVLLILQAVVISGIVDEEETYEEVTTTNYSTEERIGNAAEHEEVIFSNATVLHVEDSSVSVITREMFKLHPQLEQFRMAGRVRSIEKGAFEPVNGLSTLLLDHNLLENVPSDAISELPRLVTLSMSRNQLIRLHGGDFQNVTNLEWLSLSENNISHVHPETFGGLSRLTFLNVSRNGLTKLDGIQPLRRLTVLDLAYNYVRWLNYSHFQPLKDLQELSVRANLLDGVPSGAFSSLTQLRRLDLGDNFLKALPKRLFTSNLELAELYLDGNILESVADEQFRGLTQLQTLHLQNNRLVALPSDVFRDQPMSGFELWLDGNQFKQLDLNLLRSEDVRLQNNRIQLLNNTFGPSSEVVVNLYLYGNDIATIEQDAFEDLPRLETLYADYNRIEELPAMLFHASQRLRHVSLSRNALTVLRTNTISGLARLHSVDLSHNRLSVIEEAAFHGSRIEYLNLNDNRLKTLGDGAFSGTHLLYLYVASNALLSFDLRPDETLQNLVELSMDHNRVASLQPLCSNHFPKLVSVFLQNNSLASTVDSSCAARPPFAHDDSEPVDYDLSWNGYYEVPSLPGRVLSLDLSGNNLAHFQGYQLRQYGHLKSISLRDTSIAKLGSSDFASLTHLKRVEVGSPALSTLDEDTFHLQSLQHLAITDSPLRTLPEGLLTGQTNLTFVSFARNKISFLVADFFNHCRRLEDVDLSHNELESVDSRWFRKMEHLRAVNLEGNRISQLPADLFTPDHSLDTLSLAGNRLQSLAGATFLADVPISACNVSHNNLTEIDILHRNDFVTHLDVSGNRVSRLLVRSNFRVLLANSNRINSLGWENDGLHWELQHLEVADNLLTAPDPMLFEMRSLRVLDVSENRLHWFPFELVHRLKLLRAINVSRNDIRFVPEIVTGSFKLDTLDLSENPLEVQGALLSNCVIANLPVSQT